MRKLILSLMAAGALLTGLTTGSALAGGPPGPPNEPPPSSNAGCLGLFTALNSTAPFAEPAFDAALEDLVEVIVDYCADA